MWLLFLLIFTVFLFPYLFYPILMFFVLLILFLPFKYTFDSLLNLFTIPKQIYQIATNPDLRRNHALEHATANVLEKEYGYKNLAGYAEENGFYIISSGNINIMELEYAARKGLDLMKEGHHNLAIHQKCGTSMAAVNFVSGLIFIILILVTGHFSIINIVIAMLLANLTGPILGRYVQKKFTTSSEVGEMEIVSSHYDNYASNGFWNSRVKIFVKTEKIPYLQ